MVYNSSIFYVLNLIKINTAHQNLVFRLIHTRKNLHFIKILKSLNLINKFTIIETTQTKFINIYIYYFKLRQVGKNFKLISRPSKSFFVSLKALRLINKRSGKAVFILSTTKGIITHHEALSRKIGGLLIGFFSF